MPNFHADTIAAIASEGEWLMPDKFDPYREALVMEQTTIWPEEFADFEPDERQEIEQRLHADPEQCAHLEYIRTYTGFCRQVTVTEEDLTRLGVEV